MFIENEPEDIMFMKQVLANTNLPPRKREVFNTYYFGKGEMSLVKTAKVLRVTPEVVRQHVEGTLRKVKCYSLRNS